MNTCHFRFTRAFLATIVVLSTAACEAGPGEGELAVRIYGEEFIEKGIGPGVFQDGWTMTFSRYLVALDQIHTEGDEGDDGRYVFDLAQGTDGAGRPVVTLPVESGTQLLGFRIAPGPVATGGNAAAADEQMMADMGYALFVEGVATRDGSDVAFAWGFDTETTYHDCEVVAKVEDGGTADTTITIHADHIFYDDLDSMMPNTAFDLIAASDSDMDGDVTADELRARMLATEARYQVGSHDVDELWGFMSFLSRTVGHIDGEGECKN